MDLETQLELHRRQATEALEAEDRPRAKTAIDDYLRVAFMIMDLDALSEAYEEVECSA